MKKSFRKSAKTAFIKIRIKLQKTEEINSDQLDISFTRGERDIYGFRANNGDTYNKMFLPEPPEDDVITTPSGGSSGG